MQAMNRPPAGKDASPATPASAPVTIEPAPFGVYHGAVA